MVGSRSRNNWKGFQLTSFEQRLKNYEGLRSGHYPFNVESILAFNFSLILNEKFVSASDMLEIGVEFGGTALLIAQYLRENETLHLVDLKKTERFAESFERLDPNLQNGIKFWECSSRSDELSSLDHQKFRYIHIDGGHSKQDVHDDAQRFAHQLTDFGICVFDDFFEIRWPGVTEAVLENLSDSSIAPFLLVDRKLYCTRKENHADLLAAAQDDMRLIEPYAGIRSWIEPLSGHNCLIAKLAVNQNFRNKFR